MSDFFFDERTPIKEQVLTKKKEFLPQTKERLGQLGIKIYPVTGDESVSWLRSHKCQIECLDFYSPNFMELRPEATEVGLLPDGFFLSNPDDDGKNYRMQELMVAAYLKKLGIEGVTAKIWSAPILLSTIYRHFEATGESLFAGRSASDCIRTGSRGKEIGRYGSNLGLTIGDYYSQQGQLGLSLAVYPLNSWSDYLFVPLLVLPPQS